MGALLGLPLPRLPAPGQQLQLQVFHEYLGTWVFINNLCPFRFVRTNSSNNAGSGNDGGEAVGLHISKPCRRPAAAAPRARKKSRSFFQRRSQCIYMISMYLLLIPLTNLLRTSYEERISSEPSSTDNTHHPPGTSSSTYLCGTPHLH